MILFAALAGPAFGMSEGLQALVEREAEAKLRAERERPATFSEKVEWAALIVGGAFLLFKVAPRLLHYFRSRSDSWAGFGARAAELSSQELAEQQSLAELAATLQAGPVQAVIMDTAFFASNGSQAEGPRVKHERDRLTEFFAKAPWKLSLLRNLCSEISKPSNEKDRPQLVADLFAEARAFKEVAALPELLPVWQLTCALEGLLKQLADKPARISASTQRTAAAAIALLEKLSVRGLKPDLATNPVVRLLVVDDDPLSRLAVSSALKKVFNAPDVASGGEAALALALKNPYQVIFLDVEMPGMDGYELCTRARETEANGKTPVVFVTSHGDFESRDKSSRSGGQDLIAKPFLSFEITVKALTLVLSSRFQAAPKPAPEKTVLSVTATATNGESKTVPAEAAAKPEATGSAADGKADGLRASADVFARAFFECAPAHIEAIRNQLKALVYAGDDVARHEILGELYVSVHAVTEEAERAELRAASRLCSSLQNLLKKMLDNLRHVTTSTLAAVDSALDALQCLCAAAINLDLAEPDIRILVVDDDPIARRAICGAIQLAFSKPETADTGAEAVAAAQHRAFDVIFLDVEMPEMDGYAACAKIRKTAFNSRTPVVFVTSHSDMESRAKAALAGGCDLVPKPALAIEVSLRALSFALRARLERRVGPTLKNAEALAS